VARQTALHRRDHPDPQRPPTRSSLSLRAPAQQIGWSRSRPRLGSSFANGFARHVLQPPAFSCRSEQLPRQPRRQRREG
jgi:hypothetical protein